MSGLKKIGLALLLFGVAYYCFTTMTKYENGKGVSINRLLLIAYKLAGKNISTGILGLLGSFLTFAGIKELIAAKKNNV